ncbi:MAG TPA: FtsX-like permease family protein [bacterium]|nr:FtsX-like permease family protein [bacterium]
MGTLWKIALRNVLRHKRRTIITAIVMTVGIGLFIMMDSMLVGMDRMTIDNMVDYTESSIKVRTPEYVSNLQGTPLDHGVPAAEIALRKIMAADSHVTAVAPRMNFVASVSNYEDSIPVIATAVDPARDGAVFKLPESLVKGIWLNKAPAGSIVIGAGLAEELKVSVGDYLLLSASTAYDNVNANEYPIAGILSTPMPNINDAGVFMAFADADELLGTSGFVSEIVVATHRAASMQTMLAESKALATKIQAILPGLKVDSISDLADDYLAMRAMKSKFSYVMILVVLLIAGVGIVNTILMSVYARIREIGVLRAYGMSPPEIRRLFTIEGIIIGFVGSVGGVLFGMALVWYLIATGIPMGSLIGKVDMGGLPLTGTMYGEWNPATMAFGFIFGLVVAFIAARIPAKRAAKLEVTDALRFV